MKKVIIENQSGSSFTIDIAFSDTVFTIKQKIEKSQGIPVSKQSLVLHKVLQDHLDIFECHILNNSRLHLSISPDDNRTHNQVPQTKQSPSNPIHEFVKNQDSPNGKKNQVLHQSGKPPLPSKSSPLTREKFSKNQQDRPVITKVVARRIDNGSSRPSYSLDELLAPQGSSSVTVGSRRNRDQEVQNRVSSSSNIIIPDSPAKKKTKTNPRKMVVIVQPYGHSRRSPLEVNTDDNVEEMRKELVKMQERGELNLPQERFYFRKKDGWLHEVSAKTWFGLNAMCGHVFADTSCSQPSFFLYFIHKQAVLHEDKSFLTNGVAYGDTIEVLSEYITKRGSYPYKWLNF